MSRTGYYSIRTLYLNQLSEQVTIITQMIGSQVGNKYGGILELGAPSGLLSDEITEDFNKNLIDEIHSEIFLFDNDFRVMVHSNNGYNIGAIEPRLILSRKEINELKAAQSTASLPFKGDDGKWYLWGFYRINDNYFIALREHASRLERVDSFSTLFWLIGLAGTFLTMIIGWFLAQSITKPIQKLISFSSEIGNGNFAVSAPDNLKGEISLLGNALDSMRNNLSNNHREKEKMLAQIAHEIRNPLGGIELLANLTKEDLIAGKNNVDYLDRILSEVSGLKTLISSFLNYSKPMPANSEWVDLSSLFDSIKTLFAKGLKAKRCQFSATLNFEKIHFDRDHLRQILINLISNSLMSIDVNGQIEISCYIENNTWAISIKDNGIGISADNRQNVFEPFFTTKKDGTGLGLSISKKLCVENKASLCLSINDEIGTTFLITKEIVNEK